MTRGRLATTALALLVSAPLAWLPLRQAHAYDTTLCTEATGPTDRLGNPILFATQFPISQDFATITSVFANHLPELQTAGRGGDLYLLTPAGDLCNLTREAGLGETGLQGAAAIAVRDPDVDFDGERAVFSMVMGAPTSQFEVLEYVWQLYEVTGLGAGETVTITRVPNQPADYNNVMPIYAPDGSIVFVSDRPFNGAEHLHPQLDEYESTETPTGLWRLDPDSGELTLLEHSPSGSFDPLIDSFGRVVFTRWDHLQRDQQSDTPGGQATFGGHDFDSEAPDAARLGSLVETFPEPRPRPDLVEGTNFTGHRFNHFFPWMINLDGTEEETLNHIGRHELHSYFDRSLNDDPALREFIDEISGRTNPNDVFNVLQLAEDPNTPGRFLAIDAPEFQTHGSGQVFELTATPTTNPDDIVVTYVTHPDTETVTDDPSPDHSGHYRDPAVLANGEIVAAHAAATGDAGNLGSRAAPIPTYEFRLRLLEDAGNGFSAAGVSLTGGIEAAVSYFDPDVLVSYDGPLWELYPVEVRSRPVPAILGEPPLASPERSVFERVAVDEAGFRTWMADRGLALMVVRDATSRDDADEQQPYNLRVPGGRSTVGPTGQVYEIAHLQFYEGRLVRGYDFTAGRRVLARVMSDPAAAEANGVTAGAPPGGVPVFEDGSIAAFVPAGRAMAWQLTAPDDHEAVVRERVWITFQPGEIRVCDGCHGVNTFNQAGLGAADSEAAALDALLRAWRGPALGPELIFISSFEAGEGRP